MKRGEENRERINRRETQTYSFKKDGETEGRGGID